MSNWYNISTAKAGEKIKNNCYPEGIEDWTKLDVSSEISKLAEKAVPENDMRIEFSGAVKVLDTDDGSVFYLAIYCGGLNGKNAENKWGRYLDYIKDILHSFKDSWLVDLENDCCDDIWYLTVGFRQ